MENTIGKFVDILEFVKEVVGVFFGRRVVC